MNKYERERDAWIKETQMYQRIAKLPMDNYKDLAKAYDEMKRK